MGWKASPSNRQSSIPMGLRQCCAKCLFRNISYLCKLIRKQTNDDFVFTHVLCIYFQLLHFQGVLIVKTNNLNTGIKQSSEMNLNKKKSSQAQKLR